MGFASGSKGATDERNMPQAELATQIGKGSGTKFIHEYELGGITK